MHVTGRAFAMWQVALTMEQVQLEVLAWDFFAMTDSKRVGGFGNGTKRAPAQFNDLGQYVRLFKPLLMEELRAHLLQVTFRPDLHHHHG